MNESHSSTSIPWRNIGIFLLGTLVVIVVIGLIGFFSCFKFVDNYELGYTFDKWKGGRITKVDHTGYVLAVPLLTEAHTVDLRPMQVCISANGRVLNCKLVRFDPAGLDLFLSWHGRSDYAGPGNTTTGGNGCSTPFCEILKVYAFDESGATYPFLKIEKKTAEVGK